MTFHIALFTYECSSLVLGVLSTIETVGRLVELSESRNNGSVHVNIEDLTRVIISYEIY